MADQQIDQNDIDENSSITDENYDSSSETIGLRRGKCKWFNVAKGWGFITPLDGGTDVFVHQSVIQMGGYRSLGEDEEVEFECKTSGKGLEATRVSGPEHSDCHGSDFRPKKKKFRKIRCYNCGEFSNHIAAKCSLGPQPKKCHNCKSENHLIADCPNKSTDDEIEKNATKPIDTNNLNNVTTSIEEATPTTTTTDIIITMKTGHISIDG